MSELFPTLDDVTFADLVDLGRSIIPTVAPDWTDHNTHDPGIMLIELIAWIADAQTYSLARVRRDERRAYARLLDLVPRGPRPARGLVWPADPAAGAPPPWPDGTVISIDAAVTPDRADAPPFFLTRAVRLTAATLTAVRTRFASGTTTDWTTANRKDGATFMPFGVAPAPGDTLVLDFAGAIPADSGPALAIGVEVVRDDGAAAPADESDSRSPARLRVEIEDDDGTHPAELRADETDGLLRSGVLLLGLPRATVGRAFAITIRSVAGDFLRAPRLQRIAPNVLSVRQLEVVTDTEYAFGTGQPKQTYTLPRPGLVYPVDSSFQVSLLEGAAWVSWSKVPDLAACAPGDRRFTLDEATGVLRFGNGINGAIPPAGAALQVAYPVCAGTLGNLPKDVAWTAPGIAGAFGSNTEPTATGDDGRTLDDLRAAARDASRNARPCVTAGDLERRARGFVDLGVTRALELVPPRLPRHAVRGTRVLVAVGRHEPDIPESAAWREEIRSRLAPAIPLGQRVSVIPPRWVDVRVEAELVAARHVEPEAVRTAAVGELRDRFAAIRGSEPGWPFGRAVAPIAVKGWLRGVDGVARVSAVRLFDGARESAGNPIDLGATGLPRLQMSPADVTVARWPGQAAS